MFICDECIELATTSSGKRARPPTRPAPTRTAPTPHDPQILDQYVIGQEFRAKKIPSVAVYNHHVSRPASRKTTSSRQEHPADRPDGLARRRWPRRWRACSTCLCHRRCDDADRGRVRRRDVENIIQKLLQKCDYDIDKAQRGIVYIDEIDKISRKSDNPSITRRPAKACSRRCCWIEGTIASVPPAGGRAPESEFVQVDTTNILLRLRRR